jgi:hypothetical protein
LAFENRVLAFENRVLAFENRVLAFIKIHTCSGAAAFLSATSTGGKSVTPNFSA